MQYVWRGWLFRKALTFPFQIARQAWYMLGERRRRGDEPPAMSYLLNESSAVKNRLCRLYEPADKTAPKHDLREDHEARLPLTFPLTI